MALIYITGVAGAGKSTVRLELLRRGYKAIGGSEDDIAAFYNNATGELVDQSIPDEERTAEWLSRHTWRISKDTIKELKSSSQGQLVFVCSSTVYDDDEIWTLFDKIIQLDIDEDTFKSRVATRANSSWGKIPDQLEVILSEQKSAEEKYRKFGAITVDSTQPVEAVADEILAKTNGLV